MDRRTCLLLCLSAAAVCGPVPSFAAEGSRTEAIIHGDDIGSDEWPSACALIIEAEVTQLGLVRQPQCTCTLIAPDVVLTAAHCLDTYSLTFGFLEAENLAFYVTFDDDLGDMYEALSNGQPGALPDDAAPASAWIAHEGFALDSMQQVDGPGEFDDIALVFLEEPISERAFSFLPDEAEAELVEEGLDVVAVGYGQQDAAPANPFEPPEPGTIGERQAAESFVNEVGPTEMQIGDEEDSPRKCHGDSGGPSYAEIGLRGEDRWRVIGVTSHAYDERDCEVGGVDTRVDAYLPWLDEQLRAACEDGHRTACEEPGIPVPPEAGPAAGDDDDDDGGGGGGGAGCAANGCRGGSAAWLIVPLVGLGRFRRRL